MNQTVFLILREDRYETSLGDGYYAYLAQAAYTRAAAEALLATLPQDPMINYHLRKVTLCRDPLQLLTPLAQGERANPQEVLAFLSQEHGDR